MSSESANSSGWRSLDRRLIDSSFSSVKLLTVAALAAGAAIVLPSKAQDTTVFHASPWATLPETSSNVVRGMNDAGDATVSATIASKSRGYRLSDDRGLEGLKGLNAADFSSALGINNRGDVVGARNRLDGLRAFRVPSNGSAVELLPLTNDKGSAAYGVNDTGTVVGYSSGRQGIRAVTWDTEGTVNALSMLEGADWSRAYGINATGTAVGVMRFDGRQIAVRWEQGDVVRLDPLPGDVTSEALSINANGLIAGSSSNNLLQRHAVLWSPTGAVEKLGALPGGANSRAISINDFDTVVGTAESRQGDRAFIWTRTDGLQDLNEIVSLPAGLVLTQATAISNSGNILAVGYFDRHDQIPSDTTPGEQPRYENHELPLQVVRLIQVN